MFLQRHLNAFSIGTHQSSKEADDSTTSKAPQSMVSCLYRTYIAGSWRNVTIGWSRSCMNLYLSLVVNDLEGEICYRCKIDVTPWNFWTKKGSKSFVIDECSVIIYWDLSSAKFSGGPEPSSEYYFALVSNEEVVLSLGDRNEKVFRKTKARPALAKPFQIHKKETICAKKCFATKAKLNERTQERDIAIDSCMTGSNRPEMWISIDGIVVIHVKNLLWNFRGNQTVFVNEEPLHVLWDVHDWCANSGSGHGLFIFKVGALDSDHDDDEEDETSSQGSSDDNGSGDSKYSSAKSDASTSDFCHFLHAWKMK